MVPKAKSRLCSEGQYHSIVEIREESLSLTITISNALDEFG